MHFHENIFPFLSAKTGTSAHYGPIPLLTHGPFTSSPPTSGQPYPSPHNQSPLYPSPPDTSPHLHNPPHPSPHTSSLPLSPPSLPTLTDSTLLPSLPSSTTTTTQPPPILHTYTCRPKSSNPDPPPSCSHNIPSLPRDLPQSPEPPSPPVQVRRSGRHTAPPAKLKDYVCSTVYSHQSSPWQPGSTKGTRFPMSNFISYHRYTPANHFFIGQISSISEPQTYSEAALHPEWQATMQTEL